VLCLCPERLTSEDKEDVIARLRHRRIAFTELWASDDPAYDILGVDLVRARRVATEVREASGALLVQCWGGCNRAPTVGTALLMLLDRMAIVDACRSVQAVRGEVLTNRGFRRQLLQVAAREALLQENTLPIQFPCGGTYRWDTDDIEEFLHLLHVSIVAGSHLSFPDSTGNSFGERLNELAENPALADRHTTLVRRWVLAKLLLSELE
jgi:hypothetical protein